jgi:membrane-associated phospholipid phosphatase
MTWELNEIISSIIRAPIEWNIAIGLFAVCVGEILPYILILLLVWYEWEKNTLRNGIKEFSWMIAPAIVAMMIGQLIKYIFPFPRPFMFDDHIVLLASVSDAYGSFPSMHTMFFAALGTTFYLRDHHFGRWFLYAAVFIGIARVALGLHWAFDVIEGFLLGVLIGQIGRLIEVGFPKKNIT